MIEFISAFWREAKSREGFDINIFIFSLISLFACYSFLADLNIFYKKIQKFFFRNDFVSYIFPSVLILLTVGYFFIPKILNIAINKDIFIFLGGFFLTAHLVYVARELKGDTFISLINYLFFFSIFFILHLLLLGLYFKIDFNLHLGKVIIEGIKQGAFLIQNIFTSFS
ncbi:MAG: hypothetical protein JW867_01115 [Candidatus Omnitrophica bacterium]|nr:hypothetical protein [Candidatus Omnitrophota bacterium]